jgi:hypothetical protein
MRDELAGRVDHVGAAAGAADGICETTSQMNLRLTSAAVTPPAKPAPASATVMYGSESFRKYTGL